MTVPKFIDSAVLIPAGLIMALLLGGLILVGILWWHGARKREAERQRLQNLVEERTRELTLLSSHLQTAAENEKRHLARELHDSLGGLLVATKMDVAWLRSRLPTEDEELLLRWRRVQQSLDKGVDLKRRVVEQLRPTLLDNMGLYSALRWQLEESCGRAGLKCSDNLPEVEESFGSEASIALFRIAQESLTNILKHSRATAVDLRVSVGGDRFILSVRDNGAGFPDGMPVASGSQGLAGMRHRVRALGGAIVIGSHEEGGTQVRVDLPYGALVAPEAGAT